MEEQNLRKNYASGAETRGMPYFGLAQARRSRATLRFPVRAHGAISSCERACVASPFVANELRTASSASIVTFITPDHGVWSHTAEARRWTIEMAQFVFRQDHPIAAPGWKARAEVESKTVDQEMDNVLGSKEIERSENGH